MDQNNSQPKDLAAAVLGRIEEEHVTPHSRLFFTAKEAGVWLLWLMTVVLGALAVAVTVTVAVYRYATGYELTHDSLLSYAAEVLPYLWILVFSAMTLLAVYNLRHTKRGYRYSLFVILSSSILCSVGGGVVLHVSGLGFTLDRILGSYVPAYLSQDKIEARLWQQPEQGRLIGVPELDEVAQDGTVHFVDVTSGEWSLVVRELPPQDAALIAHGDQVRLIGELVSLTPPIFHVCGVLPWFRDRFEEHKVLAHLREEFRGRMVTNHTVAPSDPALMSPRCAEARGVRRLRGDVLGTLPATAY